MWAWMSIAIDGAFWAVGLMARSCFRSRPFGLRQADHPPLQRKDLPVELVDDDAPDAFRRLEHHDNRDRAKHEQIERAAIGQRLAQDEEHDGADDRALDAANAADHRDEDHEGG